ncbi:discoidin, CUB and LCCL domain-containing protein 2 [Nematostella vectensis]|uniref:discoidin, CUB and LCCL domain-containing protein 2 n=1 Tax=Nematostella vectensis TaxID=45351 RepID=UPI00138FF764|nr:discoidin, CUB and LCCL domain-containing protein 2 [Nematostella vectensis]XP_032239923.1 discoidin, CUB and LCCL domain-containing protein 2 [Nematostella vectensis]
MVAREVLLSCAVLCLCLSMICADETKSKNVVKETKAKVTQTPKACYEALGVQTGGLDDNDISASSKLENFTATDAWCSPTTDENQYLQIDLGEKTKLTRIATQGDLQKPDKHVKSFALLYSNDGKKFQTYGTSGNEEIFDGNVDSFTVHHNNLKTPVIARYVRINPRTWEKGICLRVELYGCDP